MTGERGHPLDRLLFRLRGIWRITRSDIGNHWLLHRRFLHTHVVVIAAGARGWVTADGQFAELRQDCAFFCLPGQLVEIDVQSWDEQGMYFIQFDVLEEHGEEVTVVRRDSPFPAVGEIVPASPVSVAELCAQMMRQAAADQPYERLLGHMHMQELMCELLRDMLEDRVGQVRPSMAEVKAYIEAHYREELTIGRLAKVANVSERHFMRLFKKEYGCSAIEYLAIHRIKQAQQLMRAGQSYRIKDIARHVGYHDDLYFRRKFKQVAGVPPAVFAKRSKQRVAACSADVIGVLLALHIIPCAAPASHPWVSYYRSKYDTASIEPLSADKDERREQLRRLAPDCMVAAERDMSDGEYARLDAIAPVCRLGGHAGDWRSQYRQAAEFLGRSETAHTWLEWYARKAETVRARIRRDVAAEPLLVVGVECGRVAVLGRGTIADVFYGDLRMLEAPGAAQLAARQQTDVNGLAGCGAARLLLFIDDAAASQEALRAFTSDELWRAMPAIRTGRLDMLPASPWLAYNAFTHELMLDEALRLWRDDA